MSGNKSYAQGCSDAGFCSAGNLQAVTDDTTSNEIAALKAIYGAGEKGVIIFHLMPELEWSFNKRNALQASIPFVVTSGKLGNNSGIGDMMISYSYSVPLKEEVQLGFTGGFRIPTGSTNKSNNNFYSLPMPYQTGLGTTDLILGASLQLSGWNFALGYQMVINNNNKNSYFDTGLGYFSSRNLQRGDDALIRVGRLFKMGKLNISPSVLTIYRVNQDIIDDSSGNELKVEGSDGITLNLNLSTTYMFLDHYSLRLDAGAPLVVREKRPDGLTRSYVAALAIRRHF
jgi:hypothetical protein